MDEHPDYISRDDARALESLKRHRDELRRSWSDDLDTCCPDCHHHTIHDPWGPSGTEYVRCRRCFYVWKPGRDWAITDTGEEC